ncbi:MAG: hypothetical protein M5U30_19375 [Burkholderiaceae bacterium]|nr:hypothetical protein [Burkholderiaceae bacterium]
MAFDRRRPGRKPGSARLALVVFATALACAAASGPALAFEPFVIRDIRVEGVQRTEPGTVFSYLPVRVGDRITDEKASEAVKALFATGFYRDVRIEAEGDVLVVYVEERPAIASVEITGAKEFDTDTLKKVLREQGLAESRIFDRATLEARRTGDQAAIPVARPLCGARHLHDHAARSAIASASRLRSRKARPRRSRRSASSATGRSAPSACSTR